MEINEKQLTKEFNEIRKKLKNDSIKKLASSLRSRFGGRIKAYGVKLAVLRKIASRYSKKYKNDPNSAYLLAEMLVKARTYEEPTIGIEMMARFSRYYDMNVFWGLEKWIDYMNTAHNLDFLCEKILGVILKDFEHDMKYLYYWAGSTNKWRRRAAAGIMMVSVKANTDIEEGFEMAKRLSGDNEGIVEEGFVKLLTLLASKDRKRAKQFIRDYEMDIPEYILDKYLGKNRSRKKPKPPTSKKPKKKPRNRWGFIRKKKTKKRSSKKKKAKKKKRR